MAHTSRLLPSRQTKVENRYLQLAEQMVESSFGALMKLPGDLTRCNQAQSAVLLFDHNLSRRLHREIIIHKSKQKNCLLATRLGTCISTLSSGRVNISEICSHGPVLLRWSPESRHIRSRSVDSPGLRMASGLQPEAMTMFATSFTPRGFLSMQAQARTSEIRH